MELLVNRIGLLKKQIAEVQESLEIQLEPLPYKIDESGYAALDAVRSTLAQAATAAEHQQLVAQIQNQLASQRKELAKLEAELSAKQQTVAILKAEQAQALADFEQAEAAWLVAAKKLIGKAQEISDASEGLSEHKPVVFSGGLLEIDRRPAFKLAENGALHFGSQPSGLLQSVPSGWGGRSFTAIDCRSNAPSPDIEPDTQALAVEPEPKTKRDLKSRRHDTQTQAPSAEPEPASDTQELQQARRALELMQSGQIENFDEVELIPG